MSAAAPDERVQQLNQLANAALQVGDIDAARGHIGAIFAIHPHAQVACWLASLEYQSGRLPEAIEWLDRTDALTPGEALRQRAQLLRGLVHGTRHEYDEAIRLLHPLKGALAYGALGRCYAALHDFPAALAVFEKLPAGDPDTRAMLARALVATGQHERGEAMLAELAAPGGEERAWNTMWLGMSLIQRGQSNEAMRRMLALAQDPDTSQPACAILADLALRSNALDLARQMLPADLRTNWAHAWTVHSITSLGLLRRQYGIAPFARRAHPHPGTPLGVSCQSLAYYGRFAHQLGDYLFMRWMADRYELTLETPDWVGHHVFELDDPLCEPGRTPVRRRFEWIDREVGARGVQALVGRDFFSPGFYDPLPTNFSARAREVLRFRPQWTALLAPCMDMLRTRGATVVALHLRLTDRSAESVSVQWYLDWLRAVWPQLDRPVLYLASDDLAAVADHFREFNLVCHDDLPVHATGVEWLQDFYILSQADAVALSVGDFAVLACMLNPRAKVVMRPHFPSGRLAQFRF